MIDHGRHVESCWRTSVGLVSCFHLTSLEGVKRSLKGTSTSLLMLAMT